MTPTVLRPFSEHFSPDYSFGPSATRARLLDRQMRDQLRASLLYLLDQLRPHLSIDEASAASLLARLEEGPTPPPTFALYGDLIQAIDQDDLTAAREILDLLFAQPAAPSELQILTLGDPRADERAYRYVRYVETDPELPLGLGPPSPEAATDARQKIDQAMALLAAADPDLSSEITQLLREIVLCSGRKDIAEYTFDGASSFLLWGAILINADRSGDALSMIEMLAHESAHNLLFGLCPDQPLLTNDPAERHASPLRHDLRPLEGIYHATFVSARMSRSMTVLALSGLLSADQEKFAREEAARTKKLFLDGLGTLDQFAHFTEPSRQILVGARAYFNLPQTDS